MEIDSPARRLADVIRYKTSPENQDSPRQVDIIDMRRFSSAQSLAEYGLILSLIAIVAIGGLTMFGGNISGMFSGSSSSLADVPTSDSLGQAMDGSTYQIATDPVTGNMVLSTSHAVVRTAGSTSCADCQAIAKDKFSSSSFDNVTAGSYRISFGPDGTPMIHLIIDEFGNPINPPQAPVPLSRFSQADQEVGRLLLHDAKVANQRGLDALITLTRQRPEFGTGRATGGTIEIVPSVEGSVGVGTQP